MSKKIKALSLALAILLMLCSLLSVSVISSGAIETYNLNVGDTKYIFLDESDKAVQSAAWTSNAPFDVEIISQDSLCCQVRVNNYISTTAIITCEYYYQQLNSLTGQIWLIKGAKSFYVKVGDGTGTQTPTTSVTPVVPDNPKGPFEMDEFTAGVYTYVVKSDGTAEVTDYEPKLETTIKIPKWMDDYDTTSIGDFAFEYCKKLEKVTLPEKVTSIGNKAFYDCEGLKTVILPEGLTEIGNGAFMYCLKLSEITIPQGVKSINREAFSICTSLKSITIPEGVTKIEKEAFSYCTALEKAVIPESIESIDATAFDECDKAKLTLYGYEGTAAESFADENGYNFVGIKKLTDSLSGISAGVIAQSDAELCVSEITDASSADEVNLALENEVAIKIFDLSLNDTQTNEVVAVKISTDNEAVKVYRIEADGTLTKINTSLVAGSIAFNTNTLGKFVLAVDGSLVVPTQPNVTTEATKPTEITTSTEPSEVTKPTESTAPSAPVKTEPSETSGTTSALPTEGVEPSFSLGDVNRDGKLNIKDATAIQKYAAKMIDFDAEQLALADYNGDTKINVKDATMIQKKIANII